MMLNEDFPCFKSQLNYSIEFPKEQFDLSHDILIYDRCLLDVGCGELIANFKKTYAVTGGESLKELSSLTEHLTKILALGGNSWSRQSRLVAMGGGSVGDFVGFVASILKRGVRWVGVPTTWLSALDSAHGGKTALNFADSKNQLGTFYPAESIFLIQSILQKQPKERSQEAMGELLKMAWISGENIFSPIEEKLQASTSDLLWSLLPSSIEAKYKIVLQDPYERKGVRKILNLGHTFGHVIESQFKLSHGEAVFWGLDFSLEWSLHRGLLDKNPLLRYQKMSQSVRKLDEKNKYKMDSASLYQKLLADKKMLPEQKIDFVFAKNIGQVVVESVLVDEVVQEARRQGWLSE